MNKKQDLISIAIIDDHALFVESLARMIFEDLCYIKAFTATSCEKLFELLQRHKPTIILLDINIPPYNGLEIIEDIRKVSPDSKILILSMHQPNEFRIKRDELEADGYVLKTSGKEILEEALKTLTLTREKYFSRDIIWYTEKNNTLEKGNILTKREKEIIRLIAEGMTSKEIAIRLNLSEHTVKTHRAHIREKMNVSGVANMIKKINDLI